MKYTLAKKINLAKILCLFLFSFCLGNYFGLLIKSSSNQFQNMLFIIFIFEIISFSYLKCKSINLFYYLNILKRGFLIGIFVEAFKVGS